MSLPSSLRRRARRRQLAAAVVLACAGGGAASLLAAGPVAVVPLQAQVQQVCITPPFGIGCRTPTATATTTASTSHSSTPKPTPASSGRSTPRPTQPVFSEPPGFVLPSASALPTLPPPSPGAPPQPPELAVQSILLQLASEPPSKPGGTALVQGTLEAERGSDTYAVPHATVTFTVSSQPGHGANVIPAELDSGDTGVVLVTVYTGDRPGDTVIHAQAGDVGADITVHADAAPSASPSPGRSVAAASVKNGPSDTRAYLVASLAALIVAVIAGYLTALAMGRLPNPLQRRSVWGRRSGTPGR